MYATRAEAGTRASVGAGLERARPLRRRRHVRPPTGTRRTWSRRPDAIARSTSCPIRRSLRRRAGTTRKNHDAPARATERGPAAPRRSLHRRDCTAAWCARAHPRSPCSPSARAASSRSTRCAATWRSAPQSASRARPPLGGPERQEPHRGPRPRGASAPWPPHPSRRRARAGSMEASGDRPGGRRSTRRPDRWQGRTECEGLGPREAFRFRPGSPACRRAVPPKVRPRVVRSRPRARRGSFR